MPGIGTFLLERKSARVDFPNKQITAPVYTILLQPEYAAPAISFFTSLGSLLHLSGKEAVKEFNNFSFDLKKQLSDGAIINWSGIGILQKGLAGDIKLSPSVIQLQETPVVAHKAIREKAEHMIKVGEDEKSAEEMTELLNREEEKKTFWWVYAMVLGILSVIFIGWHFSENGIDISATANKSKLAPAQGAAVYKLLHP